MADPAASDTGAIYDLGYRHYEGERLGRPYAVRSLVVHGLRAVFGLRRGGRSLVIPMVLGALALVPAMIQAAVAAYSGALPELITYSNYFSSLSTVFALFCAAQAPELVSADLRTNTLVLYLARALHREDYVLAKVAALGVAVFLLGAAPLLVLFTGRVFASPEPWTALRAGVWDLAPIVGASTVLALLLGSVSVALASFTKRRGIAAAAILGYFILSAAVSQLLREAIEGAWSDRLVLLDPFRVLQGFAEWIFRTDGTGPGGMPMPGAGGAGAGAEAAGALGLSAADLPGWIFGAACAAYIAVALTVLLVRYRRIEA